MKYLLHGKNNCIELSDCFSGQEIIWTHPCMDREDRQIGTEIAKAHRTTKITDIHPLTSNITVDEGNTEATRD